MTLFTRQRGRLPEQREGMCSTTAGSWTATAPSSPLSRSRSSRVWSDGFVRRRHALPCAGVQAALGAVGRVDPNEGRRDERCAAAARAAGGGGRGSRALLSSLAQAGVHCLVPSEALAATPLPGAVAMVELSKLESKLLLRTGEDGGKQALGDSGRLAVVVRGDETDEQMAAMCAREAEIDMLLLDVPSTLSRLTRRADCSRRSRSVTSTCR